MTVVDDAGPLIAADRHDRAMWAYHRRLLEQGRRPITTAPVVAQVSRDPRQAVLHRLLGACRVIDLDADDARLVGALLERSNTPTSSTLTSSAPPSDTMHSSSLPTATTSLTLVDHADARVRHRRI